MRAWFERFKTIAVTIFGAFALLLLAYLRGRSLGRTTERGQRDAQINEQSDRAREEVRNVQDQTARMDDAAIAAELKRDWVRDAGPRGR